MTHSERQHRINVIVAFGLVYIFWGSTYLGIRIAIEQIPPALMAGTRFVIAGPIMLAYCAFTGRRIGINRNEVFRLAIIGALLLSVANVILAWAEKTGVPTGLAALLVSGTPLWFLALETWVFPSKHRPSPRALVGLGLGIVGMVILLWPQLRHTGDIGKREVFGSFSLLASSATWALGSVLSKRWEPRVDPFASTGWQMTFAGTFNLVFALFVGDFSQATWTPRGIGAILYLIVFGSWVGFTAYIWLLKHVPTSKVTTYAYVNPIVAVFLGWLILHEKITGYIFSGSVVIIAAVAIVTGAKLKTKAGQEEPAELAAVESPGD